LNIDFAKGSKMNGCTKWYVTAALAVIAVISCGNVAFGNSKTEQASLAGLKGVRVVIEAVDPALKIENLATEVLSKDIQTKLTAAGIKVLTADELLKTPGMPYLYINVGTVKSGAVVAYNVQVDLRQGAVLERDPNITTTVTTWTAATRMGVAPFSELNRLRGFADAGIDEFITAFKAANPPKPAPAKPAK
jgi:hypothetical protein